MRKEGIASAAAKRHVLDAHRTDGVVDALGSYTEQRTFTLVA
jgi:hypothetical protein